MGYFIYTIFQATEAALSSAHLWWLLRTLLLCLDSKPLIASNSCFAMCALAYGAADRKLADALEAFVSPTFFDEIVQKLLEVAGNEVIFASRQQYLIYICHRTRSYTFFPQCNYSCHRWRCQDCCLPPCFEPT